MDDPPFDATLVSSSSVMDLYVGGVSDAMYPQALIDRNIVAIVNMAGNQLQLVQRMNAAMLQDSSWSRVVFDADWYKKVTGNCDFEYLRIDAEDHFKYKISDHFSEVHEFVEFVVTKNLGRPKPALLVHCMQGLNRSVAAVVAELVLSGSSRTVEEAIEQVTSKRKGKKILTNRAFTKQLLAYFAAPKAEPKRSLPSWFEIGNVVERNNDT